MIAPGETIRLNNDWIAGFTAAVSWLKGSLVPDRDQDNLQPQARIVLGDGERGLRAWAAGWAIVSIGCWTMAKIGASPGRRLIRHDMAGSWPLERHQRLPRVVGLRIPSLGSRSSLGTRPLPGGALKPSRCGGAATFQPTPQRGAGAAKCRREAPPPLRTRIWPDPPWPHLRPGQRMTCSSWIAGSVKLARVQDPSQILLHRSGIPFQLVPYLAPAGVAELGSCRPFVVGPLITAGPSHRSRAGENTSRITVSALP